MRIRTQDNRWTGVCASFNLHSLCIALSMFEDRYKILQIIASDYSSRLLDTEPSSSAPAVKTNNASADDYNNDDSVIVAHTVCIRRADNSKVMVKAIKLDSIADQASRERCLEQAAIFAQLDRPNIIKLLSYFEGIRTLEKASRIDYKISIRKRSSLSGT